MLLKKIPHGLAICICFTQMKVYSFEWQANLETGLVYDSNVALEEIDFRSTEGDTAVSTSASVGLVKEIDPRNNAGLDVFVFDTRYFNESQFDSLTSMISPSWTHSRDAFDLGLAFSLIDSSVDGEHFLRYATTTPEISFFLRQAMFNRVSASYTRKSFMQIESRDADNYALRNDLYYFLNGIEQYLGVSAQYQWEKAQDKLYDYRESAIKFYWLNSYSLFERNTKVKLGLAYEAQNYLHALPATPSEDEADDSADEVSEEVQDENEEQDFVGPQRDRLFSAFAEIEMRFSENLYLWAEYEFVSNDSYLASYSYDQHIVTLLLGFDF